MPLHCWGCYFLFVARLARSLEASAFHFASSIPTNDTHRLVANHCLHPSHPQTNHAFATQDFCCFLFVAPAHHPSCKLHPCDDGVFPLFLFLRSPYPIFLNRRFYNFINQTGGTCHAAHSQVPLMPIRSTSKSRLCATRLFPLLFSPLVLPGLFEANAFCFANHHPYFCAEGLFPAFFFLACFTRPSCIKCCPPYPRCRQIAFRKKPATQNRLAGVLPP